MPPQVTSPHSLPVLFGTPLAGASTVSHLNTCEESIVPPRRKLRQARHVRAYYGRAQGSVIGIASGGGLLFISRGAIDPGIGIGSFLGAG